MKKAKRRERTLAPFQGVLLSLMTEKKVGVREAARIAGVGASTIVSWRSGALPEDYVAVRRLAVAFGVSLGFLLTGEEDQRAEGVLPSITEVFEDGGSIFDGYAKITIQRLLPKIDGRKGQK